MSICGWGISIAVVVGVGSGSVGVGSGSVGEGLGRVGVGSGSVGEGSGRLGVAGVDGDEVGGGSCAEQPEMIKAPNTRMMAITCFVDIAFSHMNSIQKLSNKLDFIPMNVTKMTI
jgi:hypothetical protein